MLSYFFKGNNVTGAAKMWELARFVRSDGVAYDFSSSSYVILISEYVVYYQSSLLRLNPYL